MINNFPSVGSPISISSSSLFVVVQRSIFHPFLFLSLWCLCVLFKGQHGTTDLCPEVPPQLWRRFNENIFYLQGLVMGKSWAEAFGLRVFVGMSPMYSKGSVDFTVLHILRILTLRMTLEQVHCKYSVWSLKVTYHLFAARLNTHSDCSLKSRVLSQQTHFTAWNPSKNSRK